MLKLRFLFCILTFIAIHTCLESNFLEKTIPTYDINLDDPLETQYARLFQDTKPVVLSYLAAIRQRVGSQFRQYLKDNYRKIMLNQPTLYRILTQAYAFLLDLEEADILLINTSYELFCTSIVSKDSKTKELFLSRNLDFGFKEYLGKLAYSARYFRDGKLLFQVETFAGVIGVVNGMKSNSFALSLNQKVEDVNAVQKLEKRAQGAMSPLFALFSALYYHDTYAKAFDYLKTVNIDDAVYFISCGKSGYDGAVITRFFDDRKPAIRLLDDAENWFLLQTNEDETSPQDQRDERRPIGEEKMRNLGKGNISFESVFKILAEKPNYVDGATVYTVTMSPSKNYFSTKLWD